MLYEVYIKCCTAFNIDLILEQSNVYKGVPALFAFNAVNLHLHCAGIFFCILLRPILCIFCVFCQFPKIYMYMYIWAGKRKLV